MGKYTKGPWVNGYGQGITGPNTPRIGNVTCQGSLDFDAWKSRGYKKDEYPGDDYTVVSKGMDTIAIVVGDNKDANSRLIAAAPELLEALQDLVCCPAFNGKVFEKDSQSHKAWTLARYTIAKALGDDQS